MTCRYCGEPFEPGEGLVDQLFCALCADLYRSFLHALSRWIREPSAR